MSISMVVSSFFTLADVRGCDPARPVVPDYLFCLAFSALSAARFLTLVFPSLFILAVSGEIFVVTDGLELTICPWWLRGWIASPQTL